MASPLRLRRGNNAFRFCSFGDHRDLAGLTQLLKGPGHAGEVSRTVVYDRNHKSALSFLRVEY